jgi:AcrR family transcriptional regulator
MADVNPGRTSDDTPPLAVRRVRLDSARRRESLLDAAASAFADGGYEATSMEEVATRAGVTRLIVYRHFDSKEDLYRSVLDRAVAGLSAAVREALGEGPKVRRVVDAFLDAGRAYPDGFKLLVRHSAREPDFADYSERFRENAVRAAERLIARPVPDAVLRAWSAKTLVALLEEATLAWIESGDPERDEEMKTVLASSIEGMLRAFASQP